MKINEIISKPIRRVVYKWVAETMEDGEIEDVSIFDELEDALHARELDPRIEIGLRRQVAVGPDEEHLDEIDHQYAYQGDDEFDGGTSIPKKLKAQLDSLV